MTAETFALVMLGAGFLPVLSSHWIRIIILTTVTATAVMGSYLWCTHDRDMPASAACIIALPASLILGTASLAIALVRRRHRLQGSAITLTHPWVLGPLIYALAAALVIAVFLMMTGGLL